MALHTNETIQYAVENAAQVLNELLNGTVTVVHFKEESQLLVDFSAGGHHKVRFTYFMFRQTALPHADLVQVVLNKTWTEIAPKFKLAQSIV